MYWSIVSLGTNFAAFNVSAEWREQTGSSVVWYSRATHHSSMRQLASQETTSVIPYMRLAPAVYDLGVFLKQAVEKDYSILNIYLPTELRVSWLSDNT